MFKPLLFEEHDFTMLERKHVSNFESRTILLDGTIVREWGPK